MQTESGESGTWAGGWMIAAVAGVVAAILARLIGDVGMAAAVLVGILVFGVFGVLLGSGGVERSEPDHGHEGHEGHSHAPVAPVMPVAPVAAPVAPVVAPVAAPVAAVVVPRAPAPVVAPAAVIAPVASAVPVQPKGLAAARAGGADDLKVIEGIGPAMEKLCNGLGFYHFDQIAGWSAADVAWVDDNLKGFKGRATRDRWVAQARLIGEVGIPEFQRRAKTNDY